MISQMSDTNQRPVRLPGIPVHLGRAGASRLRKAIAQASMRRQFLGPYLPLSQSLEWALADLHWAQHGIEPFVDGSVPFRINNDGRLAADAAGVLFANCVEAAPPEGPIGVAELGAGTGLFARYFLDEFQILCEREGKDFYNRLTYVVTDRSPRTVEQWREYGIFTPHQSRVTTRVCHAHDLPDVLHNPLRAIFCNYLLDVLPAAILRRHEDGWRQLCQRAWIRDDAALLSQYTPLSFDELRGLASVRDEPATAQLAAVLPLIENDTEFFPVAPGALPRLAELEDAAEGVAFVYNYAAAGCLERLLGKLNSAGFILISDYGAVADSAQRFGPSVAIGLNFPLFDRLLRARGAEVVAPPEDDERKQHYRLVGQRKPAKTREEFERRFAATMLDEDEKTAAQAREMAENSRWREALEAYRGAFGRNPRNWMLISEAAEFVARCLRDHAAALELARSAVDLNPWYSSLTWNILGDVLLDCGEQRQAHEAYLQSERIHPRDANTSLKLARSWRLMGNPERSLAAVGRGLANDTSAMLRHLLLEEQQQSIATLSVRWHAEREIAARR
jgi:tetratricopeptide (TPR) repeat protein